MSSTFTDFLLAVDDVRNSSIFFAVLVVGFSSEVRSFDLALNFIYFLKTSHIQCVLLTRPSQDGKCLVSCRKLAS